MLRTATEPADTASVTTNTTKRFRALSGLAIGLALVLSACGGQQFSDSQSATDSTGAPVPATPAPGSKGAPTPAARLLAAVARTTQARTARLALTMSISGFGNESPIDITGSGVMDLAHKKFALTMTSRSPGSPLDLEMRVIGDTAYLRMGPSWISETVASTGASTPVPTDYLQYLQGISGAVRTVGHETLRGVDTTRYAVTLDLRRALTRVADASQRAAILHALDQFGLAQFPATVWVDGEGRLRRMDLSIDMSKVARTFGAPVGTQLRVNESVEMYDFGVAVDVQVPPNATKVTLGNGVSMCVPPACSSSGSVAPTTTPAPAGKSVHDTESDLRDALTAEKTEYVDAMEYTTNLPLLRQIEPTLDWGGKLRVVVGNSSVGTSDIVCLSERSVAGMYSIADIASGPRAGTYFGHVECPARTEAGIGAMYRSW